VPRTKLQPNLKQQVAAIASRREVHDAFAWFRSQERVLVESQLELARVPAPPFGEAPRTKWLKQRFEKLGLKEVHADDLGSVFGVRRGSNKADDGFIALTAHIDTVFPIGTPLDIREEASGKLLGPSVSDNCSGVIALLAIASALQHAKIAHERSIVFIGNVGEEGEGDLRGMRHIFSAEHPGKWRDRIAQTIIVDGAGTDTIVTQALGSKRFEVTVRGPGGHSWTDFGQPNPIAVLARAAAEFYKTPVHDSAQLKSTYNIGVISGGTSVNSIPESATMRVDIRSTAASEIDRLAEELRQCVLRAGKDEMVPGKQSKKHISQSLGSIKVEIKQIGDRPAGELAPNARILEAAKAVDAHLNIRSHARRASTDANIPLSLGLEAITLGTGGSGGGAHTLAEWYDPKGRDLALKRILLSLLTLAE
jgi:tripeptide aminopeptidase